MSAAQATPQAAETASPPRSTDDIDRDVYAAICREWGDEVTESGYLAWRTALELGEH